MTVKIIERRLLKDLRFRFNCKSCTSLLEYGKEDIKWCDALASQYIVCPVCHYENKHSSRNLYTGE